jgi:hypothetical protein
MAGRLLTSTWAAVLACFQIPRTRLPRVASKGSTCSGLRQGALSRSGARRGAQKVHRTRRTGSISGHTRRTPRNETPAHSVPCGPGKTAWTRNLELKPPSFHVEYGFKSRPGHSELVFWASTARASARHRTYSASFPSTADFGDDCCGLSTKASSFPTLAATKTRCGPAMPVALDRQ